MSDSSLALLALCVFRAFAPNVLLLTPLPFSLEPSQLQPLVDGLKAITGSLAALTLNGSEKKQLAECQKGCEILFDRLATPNAVDADTIAKTQTLAIALQARDYGTAGSMSQQMANTVWKDHKDWLKGMKFLTQLTAKKL